MRKKPMHSFTKRRNGFTVQSYEHSSVNGYHPAAGVRWRMKALVWRVLPDGTVHLWRFCLRFWYALRQEGRSFLGHMKTLLATKQWGVDLGSLGAYLPDGRLIPNERTKAHSLGIQELSSAHPWASSIDKEIYLEGFRAGEQFAHRNPLFALCTEAHAVVPFVTSESGNSMPPQAVQQSSKYDPLGPQPSRE